MKIHMLIENFTVNLGKFWGNLDGVNLGKFGGNFGHDLGNYIGWSWQPCIQVYNDYTVHKMG